MDDFYSSGNKKNTDNQKNNHARSSQDKFVNADYYDENFSLNFKSKGNAQAFSRNDSRNGNFRVNIPDSELNMPQPQDRTPKGRAVGRNGYGAYNQSMNGLNMPNGQYSNPYRQPGNAQHSQGNTRGNNYSPVYNEGQNSRVPRGNRVGVPAQQQGRQHTAAPDNGRKTGGRKERHQKHSPKKPLIIGFLCLLLIMVVAVGAFGLSAINSLNYDDTIVSNQYIDESSLYSSSSVKNILFIGSDARGDVEGQRSDTMILFSIDTKNGQIKLTSFLRDSYVYIPSKGYKAKLNSAFSSGGTQLVIDTIEYNFGVDIDNYVMVDFVAFQQLIDLMGGVTIDVTEKEARYMNDVVKIPSVKEGTNKMNGFIALWYCRIRKLDSDFYRTQRQRKVISAVVSQAKKTNPFTLASICKQVLPNISTDINKGELMSLAVGAVMSYLRYDIVQQQIPADGTWSNERINGSDVITMNIDENKQILIDYLSTKYVEEVTQE